MDFVNQIDEENVSRKYYKQRTIQITHLAYALLYLLQGLQQKHHPVCFAAFLPDGRQVIGKDKTTARLRCDVKFSGEIILKLSKALVPTRVE